jgi:hypothetical protein
MCGLLSAVRLAAGGLLRGQQEEVPGLAPAHSHPVGWAGAW